jgi:putative ABC transport system permease protein
MKTLRSMALRFAGLFRKERREQEFADEIESHLQMQVDDNVRAGMTPVEARRTALLKLGGIEQTKQAYRERGTVPFLETLRQDLHFAFRQFRKNPGFALTAIIILALGIGASTAIFSAVNPVIFRSLPYPNADRVMKLWEMRRGDLPMYVTYATYHGMRERSRSFEWLAVVKAWQPAMIGTREPERLEGERVSFDYFRVLSVEPALGRNFERADDRHKGPNVVILSDGLWRRRFGADPGIVGRQITLDDNLYTVLGVMPRSFENVVGGSAELWAPLQYDDSLPSDGREFGHHLQMIGRLRPHVSTHDAGNESRVMMQTLGQMYAKGYDSSGGAPKGMLVYPLQKDITRDVRPVLYAILGGVALVLLIACVNVTNLLLARGAQRRAEFAMRAAVGAGRARLLQQLVTESLLLALAGGAIGMLLAEAGVRILLALSPAELPRKELIHLDPAVFLFALMMTTLVGIFVGIIPAFYAWHTDPHTALQENSRTTSSSQQLTRRTLVVAEVAIALVLLVSAGLQLRSIRRLFAMPAGFDSSHLLTMQVQEYGKRFDDNKVRARFYERALGAVREVPGVEAAAFTSQLPLSGDSETNSLYFEACPNDKALGAYRYGVSPDYFTTMHIPLLRGRLLTENDRAEMPGAVVISESLANRLFPAGNALGQRVRMGPDIDRPDRPWQAIVGIVGDVKQESLATDDPAAFYTTPTQWAWVDPVQSLVVRTQGDPAPMATAIRRAIWSVDKDEPIVRVATLQNLVIASEAERRFALVLFEAFALAGLVLAATGIYGVLSGSVTERTREIGVRAALGASPANILSLFVGQGMKLTVVGAVIGILGALATSRALLTLLFSVSATDPVTYAGVTLLLAAVAAVACWIPARRAARVDPAITLRAE